MKKREIPLAGQTRTVWEANKKSPWRAKLGPMDQDTRPGKRGKSNNKKNKKKKKKKKN